MIEKMKRICLVSSASRKQALLTSLRDFGLLHLAEKKSADRAATERFASLSKTEMALKDYADKKKSPEPLLSDAEFETLYRNVLATLDLRRMCAPCRQRGSTSTSISSATALTRRPPQTKM